MRGYFRREAAFVIDRHGAFSRDELLAYSRSAVEMVAETFASWAGHGGTAGRIRAKIRGYITRPGSLCPDHSLARHHTCNLGGHERGGS